MIIAIQMSLTKLTDKIRQSRFYSVMTDKEHPVTTKSSVFAFKKMFFYKCLRESPKYSTKYCWSYNLNLYFSTTWNYKLINILEHYKMLQIVSSHHTKEKPVQSITVTKVFFWACVKLNGRKGRSPAKGSTWHFLINPRQ